MTAHQTASPGFRRLDEVRLDDGACFMTYHDPAEPAGQLRIARQREDGTVDLVLSIDATEFRAISELCEQAAQKLDAAMAAKGVV